MENSFKLSLARSYLWFLLREPGTVLHGPFRKIKMLLLLQLHWKPTPLFTNKLKGFLHFVAIPSVSGHYPGLSHRYMPESLHATENSKINLQIEWKPRNMSGISPPGQAAGDAQHTRLLYPCFPLCPLCQLFTAVFRWGHLMKNWCLFVSVCSAFAPLPTWDRQDHVLLSSPEPLQMGKGHRKTDFPQNITCFYGVCYSHPREGRNHFLQWKGIGKKASVLQPEIFVLYSQEQQKFPISSWI